MAVIQISRIQVRRGREDSGTGLPQLAGGELGWAVDSQSLYIGNGSVVEGAPAVGNTKIITEHDNFFDLAETYEYRQGNIQTGEVVNVRRSLSARLDDRVSVKSFGVIGDGEDATLALQKALYELYLNATDFENPKSRVVLYVEPGTYVLTSTVFIPPYVTLEGAGRDKTVFQSAGGFTMFKSISSNTQYNGVVLDTTPVVDPIISFADSSRGLNLSGFTIKVTETVANTIMLELNSARDCRLEDIKFIGPRLTGAAPDIGLMIKSKSDAIQSQFNRITDCEFVGLGTCIKSDHSIHHNDIEVCTFDRSVSAIVFGLNRQAGQKAPFDNTINGCYFEDIDQHGILVTEGTRNMSKDNKFGISVGNNGGDPSGAEWPIIKFVEKGNISLDDHFDRTYNLSIDNNYFVSEPYIPDVEGPAFVDYGYTENVDVPSDITFNGLFRLPAEASKRYHVEYHYQSTQNIYTRSGELTVIINRENNSVTLSDEYDYAGNDTYESTLQFAAILQQNSGYYTAQVQCKNISDSGNITFRLSSKS